MSWMLGPLREGIMTVLIVAGPIIIAASVLGIVIGILQTATQIQDQTLPSALKLIAILLLLIFLGMWMFTYVTNFTEKTIGRAFSMVINNRQSILTPSGRNIVNASAAKQLPFTPLPSLQASPLEANGFTPPPPSFTSYSKAPNFEDFSNPNSMPPNYSQPSDNYPIENNNDFSQVYSQPPQSPPTAQAQSPNPSPPKAPVVKPPKQVNIAASNKVTLSQPDPLPIIKPKLPNQDNSLPESSNSSLSLGNSSEGDQLPRPKSSAEWW